MSNDSFSQFVLRYSKTHPGKDLMKRATVAWYAPKHQSGGDPISVLKKSIKQFVKVQIRYAKFGANDSEVNEIITELMDFAENDDIDIPDTPENWALYDHDDAAVEVAEKLHDAAIDIIEAVPATGLNADELEELFDDVRAQVLRGT